MVHSFAYVQQHSAVKRAVANLDSGEELSSESLPQHMAIGQLQRPNGIPTQHGNRTFGEQPYHEASVIIDEKSFASIEQMVETQTNKSGNGSKLSGGTRRSRKDRSGIRGTGRQALTPHVYCTLNGQNSLIDVSPQARLLPGSDTISLELNVAGLTAPTRDLGGHSQIEEEEDSYVQSPNRQLKQSQSFVMPAQRPGM